MSSFLEKLKKGVGIEQDEKEEGEEEDLEAEELKKQAKPEIKQRKIKQLKTEEKFTEPQKAEITTKPEEKKWPEPEGQLAVDVYQTNGELVIQSTIAGVKPEELEIVAQGDVVIIKGKRERVENEERNYFYKECYWGPFSREIILPVEADSSRAEASMVEGILTIRIPKIEREKRKKITIK